MFCCGPWPSRTPAEPSCSAGGLTVRATRSRPCSPRTSASSRGSPKAPRTRAGASPTRSNRWRGCRSASARSPMPVWPSWRAPSSARQTAAFCEPARFAYGSYVAELTDRMTVEDDPGRDCTGSARQALVELEQGPATTRLPARLRAAAPDAAPGSSRNSTAAPAAGGRGPTTSGRGSPPTTGRSPATPAAAPRTPPSRCPAPSCSASRR